jgi:hypothetical protein
MLMLPSDKDFQMFDLARQEAINSKMQSKHGCVITYSGTPISSGCNYYRGLHNGEITLGVHAESSASSLLPIKVRQWVLRD